MTQTKKIQQLNDAFRRSFTGGKVVMTHQVAQLPPHTLAELISLVKTYSDFNLNNDPYQEHDFGKVVLNNNTYLWKIDYYDKELTYGSSDPSNKDITTRVLTIMCGSDY